MPSIVIEPPLSVPSSFEPKSLLKVANAIREAANSGIKVNAIIAPSYTPKALRTLSRVKHRPILEIGELRQDASISRSGTLSVGSLSKTETSMKLHSMTCWLSRSVNQQTRSLNRCCLRGRRASMSNRIVCCSLKAQRRSELVLGR